MSNPWERIGLDAYEAHMGSQGVLQLQALSRITREQLGCRPAAVAVLGASGGNGLEHIDPAVTAKVYAVDINGAYLEACRARHGRLGFALETLRLDLAAPGAALPSADLLICNLIVEYLGVGTFAELIGRNAGTLGIVSCVIQNSNGRAFVSASGAARSLECLEAVHRDVGEADLTDAMRGIGFGLVFRSVYGLPNGKEFVRLDYVKRDPVFHSNGDE